ncbi:MAG: hypothetical protein AB7F91_12255 [Parvularculaceae bacterium]
MGVAGENGEAITAAIEQLEAYIAAEDAVATAENGGEVSDVQDAAPPEQIPPPDDSQE